MKQFLLLSVFFVLWNNYNRIAEMNALKEEAYYFYQKRDYNNSMRLYERLISEYGETDERLKLNLANSYFQLKLYNKAIEGYKALINSAEASVKSTAYLQMGVIYSSNKKKEIGLNYFREALKAFPENEEARYNFELLKKEQDRQHKESPNERKKENQNGKNKTNASTVEEMRKSNDGMGKGNNTSGNLDEEEWSDEENTGGEDEEELQYNSEGDKETDALTSKRLEEVHLNERQARMILKTMKNAEIQYIQQRKKNLSSKPAPGKPDW